MNVSGWISSHLIHREDDNNSNQVSSTVPVSVNVFVSDGVLLNP